MRVQHPDSCRWDYEQILDYRAERLPFIRGVYQSSTELALLYPHLQVSTPPAATSPAYVRHSPIVNFSTDPTHPSSVQTYQTHAPAMIWASNTPGAQTVWHTQAGRQGGWDT
jgi:hypothetical protein